MTHTNTKTSECGGSLSATDENNSTKTSSAWGGNVAHLSKKSQKPFPQWAFIGFNLHRNTGLILKLNHCQAVMIKQ